jgi:replicative DNA helicase
MAQEVAPGRHAKSDRLPPYSEEAERGILGCALQDAERVIDLCIDRKVSADSFHVAAHRTLFENLLVMHQLNQPVDLLTVSTYLRDRDHLEKLGGDEFLERIVDTTPTSAHIEHYISIVYDKHVKRRIIDQARKSIDACFVADEPAEMVLGAAEQGVFEISEEQISGFEPWPTLIRRTMEDVELIFQNKKGTTGISSGYKDVDKKLLGFQPTDMIILAARPSMGKTSLALNLAERIALGDNTDNKPRPVAVFSLEMSSDQLAKRMLCCKAGVSGHKLSSGFISTPNHRLLMSAADTLNKAQIFLDDTPSLSPLELRSRARRMKRLYGIEFIVVDYLQLMQYPEYRSLGRQQEVAAISGALKAMAKELKVPVLVLSQLSRAPETRDKLAIPKMSDLRDSGSIEQDADVIALLRRPCKYPEDPDHELKRLAIVDIAKHRNGPTGEVRLFFEEDVMRFENWTEGVDGEAAVDVSLEEGVGV